MYDGNSIFVFGSNLAGRHGKGAALYALKNCGAKYGVGEGLRGNSYAIPTKNSKLEILSISEIAGHVAKFIKFAEDRPDLSFVITPIGCGLAGYTRGEIRPLFVEAERLENVAFHSEWGLPDTNGIAKRDEIEIVFGKGA